MCNNLSNKRNWHNDTYLIFTEKDGFYELPNTNYDETWNSYHLKDREKEVLPKTPLLRIE